MPPAAGSGVEHARQGFEAFSRHDYDAALAVLHPDIEWHVTFPVPDLPPGRTTFHGREEVLGLWETFSSIWESIVIEMEGIDVEEPTEHGWIVIAAVRFRGLGAGSGAEVDRAVNYLLEIEDDQLIRLRPADSLAKARSMAGLDS
ncbi:MAG: nuclear transport factor 2 family protein [Actinomycetota bacterium]|nr:nuclear transport factor 2 family protein [Actinomycetota bacterium]